MTASRNTILAMVGVVAIAAVLFLRGNANSPKGSALAVRQSAMEMLGARIAKLRPGCKVLVLSNPFAKSSGYLNERNQFERASLRGLKKGLGRRSTVTVVFPEIRPEYFVNPQSVEIPSDSRTPLSFLMRSTSVQQLCDAHPDCLVVVSLIGLPSEVTQLRLWSKEDPRCFALLLPDLRLLGAPENAAEAFQREKLLAAVTEDPSSSTPLIVTRENIATILENQPQALGY